MIKGCVVGIVRENKDPEGQHRVLVEYPVESPTDGPVRTTWCRFVTPMAGKDRGLVFLPEVGSEVVLVHADSTPTPFVLGAVYNGNADPPEPYKNDDGNDDKRVLWTRGGHMLVFDDTAGAESVGLGAGATSRLDVTSAPVHHVANAAQKTLVEVCQGDTTWEAKKTVSITCVDFTVSAKKSICVGAKVGALFQAEAKLNVEGKGNFAFKAAQVAINPGAKPPKAEKAPPTPPAKHGPRK